MDLLFPFGMIIGLLQSFIVFLQDWGGNFPYNRKLCKAILNVQERLLALAVQSLGKYQQLAHFYSRFGYLCWSRHNAFECTFFSKSISHMGCYTSQKGHSSMAQANLVPHSHIPRASFISWLAILDRLPTKVTLASWGIAPNTT